MSARAIAVDAWGAELPAWLDALLSACETSSQNKVAHRLGVSAALVSQVIRGKYPGDMARIEEMVRGALMSEHAQCPALGEVRLDECRAWRAKAKSFSGVNAQRVQMFRACNRCAVFKGEERNA